MIINPASTNAQLKRLQYSIPYNTTSTTTTPPGASTPEEAILLGFQPYNDNLYAIANLTGTTGLLRKTGAGIWTLDNTAYLTGITSSLITSALGYTPESTINKGVAGGYASLDGSGLIPASQLPSYVDDVLEYANLAAFPNPGVQGKIYVDLSLSKIYRWSGSTYIEITPTIGESDPVFTASPAYVITNTNISQWNTAYGWGNHTLAGYLTSYTETDPVWTAEKINYYTKTQADGRYLQSFTETDPIYTASSWYTTTNNSGNWNTAYGWGNHASAGYLLASTAGTTYVPLTRTITINGVAYDLSANRSWTISTGSSALSSLSDVGITSVANAQLLRYNSTSSKWENWTPNYLTSFTETDPVFVASAAYGITGTNISNWNTTYGWGNHASAGYLTTITSFQVTTALGYTPYNATNPNGYTSNIGTVTSVSGTGTVSGLTLSGTVTTSGNLTLGGTLSLTSGQVTTALGYTPYNSTNPNGYITSSGSISGSAGSAPLLSALGNYVWASSTLPTSYSYGIQASFVGPSAGEGSWQNYGSVMTMRTYSAGGGSLQLYVPYGPNNGGNALQVRFGDYSVSTGNSWTAWKTLLQSDNYNSYAPTLTGTGASGTWGINITGNAATVGGLSVHAGRNNEADKVVRTDVNGYIQAGWINTLSGDNGTTAVNRIYASEDGYIRYYTPTNFRTVLDVPTRGGSGASGTWGINITGTAARATRANGNFYIDDNYGNGIVGVYSSVRYQGVFAMGDSYKLPADGTTTGSLYGLAWSHPNAGGAAANLNSHGLLVMENGAFLAAISGSIRARDDVRAPAIYDSGSRVAISRGEGRNYVDYSRYVYNNGAYSGSGWVEPSDLGVRYANSAGSANSVAWTNVSGRPTAVSSFTNDSGYITSGGRAYPRRWDGGDLNFYWSGQSGQPPWLWGGSDGTNMYVYNPSNFSVNYATTAGTASNISAYTINQNLGTGNSPTFSSVNTTDSVTSNMFVNSALQIRSSASAPGATRIVSHFKTGATGGTVNMIQLTNLTNTVIHYKVFFGSNDSTTINSAWNVEAYGSVYFNGSGSANEITASYQFQNGNGNNGSLQFYHNPSGYSNSLVLSSGNSTGGGGITLSMTVIFWGKGLQSATINYL